MSNAYSSFAIDSHTEIQSTANVNESLNDIVVMDDEEMATALILNSINNNNYERDENKSSKRSKMGDNDINEIYFINNNISSSTQSQTNNISVRDDSLVNKSNTAQEINAGNLLHDSKCKISYQEYYNKNNKNK